MVVMPALLLQQPHATSSHKQRVECWDRRLGNWIAGEFEDLLLEGRVIQKNLERWITV